jgi:hypothetical protein
MSTPAGGGIQVSAAAQHGRPGRTGQRGNAADGRAEVAEAASIRQARPRAPKPMHRGAVGVAGLEARNGDVLAETRTPDRWRRRDSSVGGRAPSPPTATPD